MNQLSERLGQILALESAFMLTASGEIPQKFRSEELQQHYSRLGCKEIPKKVLLRVVQLKGRRMLQTTSFTARQSFTKNAEIEELSTLLGNLAHLPFSQFHLQCKKFDIYFRRSSLSEFREKQTAPSRKDLAVLEHDSEKNLHCTPENSFMLLRELKICDSDGNIIPAMRAKYKQINHFIEIASSLDVFSMGNEAPLRIIDAGCGKAYLSFALVHWLETKRGKTCELIGIDTNSSVIDFCRTTAHKLGYTNATFYCAPILSVTLPETLSENQTVLVALHACDTATDDALTLGIQQNVVAFLAAPCCHHYVNSQLKSVPDNITFLSKDGIIRERFADLLTDSLRRDTLQAYGFSSSLIEFIAPEHTAKNIMIRAERRHIISQEHISHSLIAEKLQILTQARSQFGVIPKFAERTLEQAEKI